MNAGTSLDAVRGHGDERVALQWARLMQSHFSSHRRPGAMSLPSVGLPPAAPFQGEIGSGRFGAIDYCYVRADAHRLDGYRDASIDALGHVIALQFSGSSDFSTEKGTVRLCPGDMLLMNELPLIDIVHSTHVELLFLLQPFKRSELNGFRRFSLLRARPQTQFDRLVFRWVHDACLANDRGVACEGIDDMSGALAKLLATMFRGADAAPPPVSYQRVTRAAIEDYISRRLDTPDLRPDGIAKVFSCSIRTLHRTFQRGDGESLARYIWRRRLEACAAELRNIDAAGRSITDIALHWGFKSPSHFSSLFSSCYGENPSQYRSRVRAESARSSDMPPVVVPLIRQESWLKVTGSRGSQG